MGFASGAVAFVRFRVKGPKPRAFGEEHLDRLREHRCGAQRVASADGVEVGWAAGRHCLDGDFTPEKNVFPDHLLFDLWVQTDRLPADRLKAYYETDLTALAAGNPSGFPSARQKREAREAARERLGREAKDGRFKKWALVPVAWDLGRNEVFFGNASATQIDRFTALFRRTFAAHLFQPEVAAGLECLTAGRLALDVSPLAKDQGLSEFVRGTTPGDAPAWTAGEGNVDFLGNEFLLWLWFRGECESDALDLGDGSEATFMFSGGVKLECPRGQTGDDTMNHAGPARLPEARKAIQGGKLPRKVGLTLVRHDEQYALHLQAETLAVSRAKLPNPADKVSARDAVAGRLQHARDLAETLDLMFARFLAVRLSADWCGELARVQRWLARPERQAA